MLTASETARRHKSSRGCLPGVSALLGLYRQRRALAEMDPKKLSDIGVTRSEAETEEKRPVWDVPAHWRR